jgi:hypothetical protein
MNRLRGVVGVILLLFGGGIVFAMLVAIFRGPLKVERFVEIGPSETAFVIPLEGDLNEQVRTDSLRFLEEAKVNTKRISIPQRAHQYGRIPSSYRWISTVRVIKVNRAPVTREWTAEATTGTSAKNESLVVQSHDGVVFALGGTITCRIEEEDAALYLRHFGTVASEQQELQDIVDQARPLADVVDTGIRSYMQSRLFYHFSGAPLDEAKQKKIDYFNSTFHDAVDYFKQRGITIDSFGSTKGLTYLNPKVQDAINQKFLVENDRLVTLQEKIEAEQTNAKKIAMAKASRDAAEKFLESKEAMLMSYELEIKLMQAEARRAMAENWDGQMPRSILPSSGDSQLLLNVRNP